MHWLELDNGPLHLSLSPSIGGSIARFDWIAGDGTRHALMRGCHTGSTNVLDAACFPLVPFVNRIRASRFAFGGREVALRPNMAGDGSVLHGQGWLSEWVVESSGGSDALLEFNHEPGEWPWAYHAAQRFSLDEYGLTVRLTCRNTSPEPMPCGLGQHPYFPCTTSTVLDTVVSHAWEIDEQILPIAKVAAAGRFDLCQRKVCGQGLDHGFGGWAGTATINDPAWPVALAMSSPDARFFQLYSPREGGLFVAEPVSHANAALNAPEEDWPELGLRVLEPGGAMSLAMRIDVTPVRPNRA